jgi:hypothetical protein
VATGVASSCKARGAWQTSVVLSGFIAAVIGLTLNHTAYMPRCTAWVGGAGHRHDQGTGDSQHHSAAGIADIVPPMTNYPPGKGAQFLKARAGKDRVAS